ncbi:carbon catabolite repression protein [Grosmannia clavigera kw1407]|uniref:Carbon catabolite repression protein n=1 Tax=Grosmannia clavigera (strain kw1407 / UAMH 11150) TaxID=655863 RepID=F0XGB4_GROCL|nr:carbon catabolite repression protein [Grosmannia clavigera kw1407]EFX02962.1 carbon catabolite repression protein [Grosmannia clavigera kw1407]
MPFNPFTSVTGRNALTLFDIRLETDFLVFRGNEHEASGQMLKGVLAICVPAPIKIEDIHLRLTGVQRLAWNDPRSTPSTGLSSSKIDRSNVILQHQWAPFWGTPGKSAILEKGNYEFPFDLLLPGDTSESVEGLHEASITYKLKATIARGKLAYDLHAYKHVRFVRTMESSALEFLHAMSVENVWPNKIEYSIVVPRKAIVFGSAIPLETRFSPLLKGLELGDITIRLFEIHEFVSMPMGSSNIVMTGLREYKNERVVASWVLSVNNEDHWNDMIEDTGQEGWVLNTSLDLPHKLGPCIQDVNVHGIKVRHKLKMVVALKNPDGHVSELRATLPLTLFISPNIPLDEQGNLTCPARISASPQEAATQATIAPPGYGEHILDQLYDEMDVHNLQTPAPMSAMHSPLYGLSRAGSSENLASMAAAASIPVPPAALTSRLQDVSLREATIRRNRSSTHITPPISGVSTPYSPVHGHLYYQHMQQVQNQQLQQALNSADSNSGTDSLSRRNSGESHHTEHSDPEHVDFSDMSELCKVPSYGTAMKNTRVAAIAIGDSALQLPDYRTAAASGSMSLSSSPVMRPALMSSYTGTSLINEPLSLIAETPQDAADSVGMRPRNASYHSETNLVGSRRRHQSGSTTPSSSRQNTQGGDSDERSWLHLRQSRNRVAT